MRSAGSLGLVAGVSSSPGILRGSPYTSSATDACSITVLLFVDTVASNGPTLGAK
jgi:hypothetical protein